MQKRTILGRIFVFLLKYFAVPFAILVSVWFLFFTILNIALSTHKPFVELALANSLYLAFLFSIIVLVVQFGKISIPLAHTVERNKRIAAFVEKHFPRRISISVETRLSLRRYSKWSVLSAGAAFVSLLLINASESGGSYTSTLNMLGFAFYVLTAFSIMVRSLIVSDRQIVDFHLRRFSEETKEYLDGDSGVKPNLENVEEALKLYQGLFDYCKIPKVKERLAQIRLVLDRGSKKEVQKLSSCVDVLSISFHNRDLSSFDAGFGRLTTFLEKTQRSRKDIVEFSVASKRDKLWAWLRSAENPVVHTVLAALLLATILYIINMLFGVKLYPM